MREIKRYISRNWIWIVAGLILTGVLVKEAYVKRGFVAYGGEWLTLPLILMVVELVKDVAYAVRYLFKADGYYGSDRD